MKTQHQPTLRVLRVLDAAANCKDGLTLTQLAQKTGSPKSTLFPIIQTLLEAQYLQFLPAIQRYFLGIKSFEIGQHFFDRLNMLEEIKHEMHAIVSGCSETCHLGILDSGDVLYLHKEDSIEPIRMVSSVGKRMPAYGTGLGKALLSGKTEEELHSIYPNGLAPLTPHTITDFSILVSQLEQARTDGLAYEKEESNLLIQCVAVPLRKNDCVQAALSVAIPIFRVTDEKLNKAKNLLLDAQKKIENLLFGTDYDFSRLR